MVETIMVTITEASTAFIVIISEDALTFSFEILRMVSNDPEWFSSVLKSFWLVGALHLNPPASFVSLELGSVSEIAGAASAGESTKLVLRTKDEATWGEVRVGTNSSSAGETEMLVTIEDDMRGC